MNPTIRNFLFLGALTLGLTACPQGGGTPRVLTIDPANGAAEVPVDVTIRAELSLPDGQVDVSTLTDETVTLTDAAGTPVEAGRMMVGSTLEVDPAAELAPGSAYTFSVTSALQTENGVPVTGASSTFTTTRDGDNGDPDGGLSADRERVVFSAGGAFSNDLRTLTLTNTGTETLEVSSAVEGDAEAQFSLAESAFSLAPGEARTLELTFTPSGLGPQLATLVVTSSGSPTLNIPLGGLGVAGQGGNAEPSLQWIFDTYGLPLDSGDDDASSTPLVDRKVNGFIGDEVSGQTFTKASADEPVTVEVLATFGVENDPVLEFGTYTAGNAAARTELFTVEQTPGLNEQRLAPELNLTGGTGAGDNVTFDPGAEAFGFYSYWPTNTFFGERTVYTEDTLNTFTDAIPHQVRAYPLVNADGTTEANAYVLATEEFSRGFDYNDVVFIVRNVVPALEEDEEPPQPVIPAPTFIPANGISGLSLRNPVGVPYQDRLVLQEIVKTTGNFCDIVIEPDCKDPTIDRWRGIKFPNTGVVELRNMGATPLQLSISLGNQGLFILPGGESTLSLQPGQSYDLTVQFAPSVVEDKGVYPSSLVVQSGSQSAGIELRGLFMRRPEGSGEVYFGFLVNDLFGYKTDLGTLSNGGLRSPEPDSSLAGEEVRSAYWQAADSGKPITALQLAAFYPCCTGSTFPLSLVQRSGGVLATMSPLNLYKQSILPRGRDGSLTELTTDASASFAVSVAGYSSDVRKGRGENLGIRFWPLRDRSGRAFPDTYIVAQDFVEDGCNGFGAPPENDLPEDLPEDVDSFSPSQVVGSNCDYQDNLYIMTNLTPAD